MRHKTVKARFDERWIPEPNTGCWLWTGHSHKRGYGWLTVQRKSKLAHRVAWELFRGPIGTDLHVCHRCDTPACVNPGHLFLGTRSDNQRDCENKGRRRHLYGENHRRAKLTDELVRYARMYAAAGGDVKALAKRLGVSQAALQVAVVRKTWRHVQ